jgi:PAS domain S-box-containing protein
LLKLEDILTPIDQCLSPENTLLEAVELMKSLKIQTIPVADGDGLLAGVFTKSSLYAMVLQEKPLDTPIGHFMKRDVISINENTSYEEFERITEHSGIGTGIIVNSDLKVVGLVTKSHYVFTLLQATRSLKDQLEEIIDTSKLGAVMTDENSKIILANRKFCEMIGYKESQVLHYYLDDIIPNFHLAEMDKTDHYRMKIGIYHAVANLSKYRTIKGNEGFIVLFQDISEVEKMAQELQTVLKWKTILQTVINTVYDGFVMINEAKEITFISPSVLQLFELNERQSLNKLVDNILPELGLSKTIKTGISDISEIREVKGIRYVVQRIPIVQEDEVIGAIGKIAFRGLEEMRELSRRFELNQTKDGQREDKKMEYAQFTFEQIITADKQMEKLIRSASKAAKGQSTVLIRGESGTGKELFAHAIHNASSRKDGPFVTVNCAAVPEHLLESEFFGYEEGAFTGANRKGKIGKFDLAIGGTLFLDEVGDMSFLLQAKLLRVLQGKEFFRVGGTERIKVDVRIIAATHRPLEDMVRDGQFREDLYYRLNVFSFVIPPLRNRKDDILLLSEEIIVELNRLNGTAVTGIDPEAQKLMLNYNWPGNVRELRNVLERSMIFAEQGKIKKGDLPDYLLFVTEKVSTDRPLLEKAEESAIQEALQKTGGNKTRASQLLGISRSVLYEKLRKYKIK